MFILILDFIFHLFPFLPLNSRRFYNYPNYGILKPCTHEEREIKLNHIIYAENLEKYYGDFQALKGISFSINQGECFGFLGHNGAGKSTTMRMLYGLSSIDAGNLVILGHPIRITPPAVKQFIGIVPQEDNLDPDLTVSENLEVYGGLFGMSGAEAKERSTNLLTFMGLEDKVHDKVDNLSGGLKRRLVIARALINNPKIVVLDEPTTGLDPQARHLVWQKLRGLKSEGVTLILTTHYMEEAAQLCDRLVIMHEGTILAEGSPESLLRQHVLPYVVEVRIPLHDLPDKLTARVTEADGEVLQVVDGLFLYTSNGEELWNSLGTWGLPKHACFMRPSTLEDVFLKLTGKGGED